MLFKDRNITTSTKLLQLRSALSTFRHRQLNSGFTQKNYTVFYLFNFLHILELSQIT